MVDTQDTSTGTPPFGGEQPGAGSGDGAGKSGGIDVQAMLGQLQGMITKVAHASEPALREVAAKAAELAAVAADRAGPLAHTLADKTEEVGHTVAGKASEFASSMRAAASRAEAPAEPAETPVSDLPFVSDPAEDSPRDGA